MNDTDMIDLPPRRNRGHVMSILGNVLDMNHARSAANDTEPNEAMLDRMLTFLESERDPDRPFFLFGYFWDPVAVRFFAFKTPFAQHKPVDGFVPNSPHDVFANAVSTIPVTTWLDIRLRRRTRSNEPGEYPYICAFHPHMKGRVVVSPKTET